MSRHKKYVKKPSFELSEIEEPAVEDEELKPQKKSRLRTLWKYCLSILYGVGLPLLLLILMLPLNLVMSRFGYYSTMLSYLPAGIAGFIFTTWLFGNAQKLMTVTWSRLDFLRGLIVIFAFIFSTISAIGSAFITIRSLGDLVYGPSYELGVVTGKQTDKNNNKISYYLDIDNHYSGYIAYPVSESTYNSARILEDCYLLEIGSVSKTQSQVIPPMRPCPIPTSTPAPVGSRTPTPSQIPGPSATAKK